YRDSLFEARDSERLERIISDVERMDQSVRDLITFAQTDQDNAEQVGLHALMRDAVAMSGPIMHNIPIRYALTSEDDRIYARPGHVRHIFINLLRNAAVAMENSPDGSAITLKTYREGGCFVVEVQDQGCGIPEADLERIFEPFFSTRRSSGGSGIGLAVVRMLASRQRASVQVTSQVGVGSAFLVSFPASDTTP
ncbi:MAG: HAMP domain-containing sensor histidine kinase, partial [Myxococcota bacterium]